MLKHVIVLLATAVAFGFSIHMMAQLIGYASPWMVLMLFMCFLGLAKVAEPVYMLKLPAGYRRLRPWELAGRVYRKLGVRQFGTLLKDTPLRFLNLTVYVSGERRDLRRICRQVESAEAIHFWSAILLLPYLALCIWTQTWALLGWFAVLQLLGNAYPIMHLRLVRGRLERASRVRVASTSSVTMDGHLTCTKDPI